MSLEKEERQKQAQELTVEILLGRPMRFNIGRHRLAIYPETLGSATLAGKILESIGVNETLLETNAPLEAVRLCTVNPDSTAELIALATCNGEKECLSQATIRRRAGIILEADVDDRASLLLMVLTRSKWRRLTDLLGLDDEQKEMARISRLKSASGGSLTYGGRSVFGQLIDTACARYGWTDRHVIWEVPLDRLRMMLADTVNSIYLSEEERARLCIFRGDDRIDGDTADIELLRNL